MKLPLRDLERLRADPRSFGQPRSFFTGMSKNRALHLAVYKFHKERNDLVQATNYFENLYRKSFKAVADMDDWLDQLATYAAAHKARGYVTVEAGRRTSAVSGNVELTGEIPRLDLDLSPGRAYAVWILVRDAGRWWDELRMPLMQAHVADRMHVARDRVAVGVYDFETETHDQECFGTVDIERAEEELYRLASDIAAMGR